MVVICSGKVQNEFILPIELNTKCLLYMLVTMLDAKDMLICFGSPGSLQS